jgi:hypothetical protein
VWSAIKPKHLGRAHKIQCNEAIQVSNAKYSLYCKRHILIKNLEKDEI